MSLGNPEPSLDGAACAAPCATRCSSPTPCASAAAEARRTRMQQNANDLAPRRRSGASDVGQRMPDYHNLSWCAPTAMPTATCHAYRSWPFAHHGAASQPTSRSKRIVISRQTRSTVVPFLSASHAGVRHVCHCASRIRATSSGDGIAVIASLMLDACS